MRKQPSPTTSSPAAPSPEGYSLGRWFTAARRQGLLAALSAEVWHTLSAVLSFTSRDGRRPFTLDQLALALGLSHEQAQQRLEQLVQVQWQEQPLVTLEQDRGGEVAGALLSPLELLERTATAPTDAAAEPAPTPSEAPPDGLIARLERVGLEHGQIEWLLDRFPVERVQRQLEWLPARSARNPAAMLIRAVEGDWAPPRETR